MLHKLISWFTLFTCFVFPLFAYAIDPQETGLARLQQSEEFQIIKERFSERWDSLPEVKQKRALLAMKKMIVRVQGITRQWDDKKLSTKISSAMKKNNKFEGSQTRDEATVKEEGLVKEIGEGLGKIFPKNELETFVNDLSSQEKVMALRSMKHMNMQQFSKMLAESKTSIELLLNQTSKVEKKGRWPAQAEYRVIMVVLAVLMITLFSAVVIGAGLGVFFLATSILGLATPVGWVIAIVTGVVVGLTGAYFLWIKPNLE